MKVSPFAKPLAAVALCFAASVSPLSAQSLADEEYWNNQNGYMDRSVKDVEEVCGVKIPYAFNKPSFDPMRKNDRAHSPNGMCSGAYDTLASLCRSSDSAKSRVAQKIQRVECSYGGKGKGSFALKGGTFTYVIDTEAPNVGDARTAFLKQNL